MKNKEDVIPFKPFQIAYLTFNKPEDWVYGLGIIQPNMTIINSFLGSYRDMHVLSERKANSPYHIKVGDVERDMLPSADDLANISADLEWLNNKAGHLKRF